MAMTYMLSDGSVGISVDLLLLDFMVLHCQPEVVLNRLKVY